MDSTNTPVLYIAGLAFVAIFFAVLGLASLSEFLRSRREMRARVTGDAVDPLMNKPDEDLTGLGYLKEIILGLLGQLGEANREKEKAVQGSALQQRLMSAGFRRQASPAIFTGVKVLVAVGLPLIVWLLPIPALDEASLPKALFAYLIAAGAGLYGPDLWLHQACSARQLRLVNGFPDALDLLVVCIEAGLGLDAAISRTGVELSLAHPDLCDELHMVSLELRAGLPRPQALTNLGWRANVPEIKSLVALLIQTDRFGTSVGQALRVHSDAMRVARTQRAEEKAGKLPVKLLFPLMLFIFPSIFIVILGPAIVRGIRILLPAMAGQ